MLKKIALIMVAVSIFSPTLVFAHAHLKKSEPKENSVVKKTPEQIFLSFSVPLEATMSKIDVKDSAGNPVATGPVMSDADDPRNIHVSLKDVKESKETYKVEWKAVAKDTHKMLGTFKFTVDPRSK